MSDEASTEPTPGKHLRKNQKQILAMLRAAAVQAGFEWQDEPAASGRGTARALREGREVARVDYAFGTNGIDATIARPAGTAVQAKGLYTDATLILDALKKVLS